MALTQDQADRNRIDLIPPKKKKPNAAERMAAQAAAAQQEPAAIDSYITAPEEQEKPRKKLVSFYCDQTVYEQLQQLARYRAVNSGTKNERGQGIGAGTLINEAATEYAKNHAEELRKWKLFEQATKNFFDPDNLARFIEKQKHAKEEQEF